MNDSEMIFSIVIWLVIIASLIYLLIRKIIKEENEDFENRDYWYYEKSISYKSGSPLELYFLNVQKTGSSGLWSLSDSFFEINVLIRLETII